MDWIKKRYDQFLLTLAAVALLAFAIMIVLKVKNFGATFAQAMATVVPKRNIPPLVLRAVEDAKVALENPPAWVIDNKEPRTRGSLFVSDLYIVGEEGIPKKPNLGTLRSDSLTGKGIPNSWLMDNNLPLREANVTLQDPDKDGFSNEDEWRENTDPNNKDLHPAYHTKLFLKQFIQVRFRLIFNAVNGDLKKPETLEFQINTVDLRQPSEFLKLGDMVPNTKFKLEKFEPKEVPNENTGVMDVSELTLMHVETGDRVVLVITKVTNSPDVFGVFEYQWPQPPQDIRVKRLQEFALKPETDKRYKLVDIKETEAVIQLPNGDKYTVVRDPRKVAK